jgi:hypothetical protein
VECTIDAETPGAGRFVCFGINIVVVRNSDNTSDTAVSNCQ